MVDYQTLSIVFTGLSISIAAFYYISTLRNAQKSRQVQMLLQLIQSRADHETANRFWRLMRMNWDDFDDYIRKYRPDTNPEVEEGILLTGTWNFYNGLGLILKEGLVNMETMHHVFGSSPIMVWFKCETIIKGLRVFGPEGPGLDYMGNFEFLADELIRFRRERGLSLPTGYLHPTSELQNVYYQ
jgi:hypothetical protein